MQFQIVGFTLGLLITILGFAELVPALIDWARSHDNALVFLFNGAVCLFFGGALMIANRNTVRTLGMREAFFLTVISWLALTAFAALPLYMANLQMDYADAFFEAMSGFTTTGATALTGLDNLSHGVLVWRSLMQWIGGIGIVGFALLLLPYLKVGGIQLLQAESSQKSDKILSRSKDVVLSIFTVYCSLTIVCMVVYFLLGMNWFDAVNHAMTTVSTGGFSTHDLSLGYYQQPLLHYAASLFMFISAMPFNLLILWVFKRQFRFFQDEQVKAFLGIAAFFIVLLTFWLWYGSGYSFEQSFRFSLFNLVSVLSTTGFHNADYGAWGSFSTILFLIATYIGGTAGSASGGPKTLRLVIAAKIMNCQIKNLIYPRGSFTVQYQGRRIDQDVALNVLGFLSFYVLANVVLSIAVAMNGTDFLTSMSAVAAAMANVSHGVGPYVGPGGTFAGFSDSAKWILAVAMLLGRLEILTIAVLLTKEFWQK